MPPVLITIMFASLGVVLMGLAQPMMRREVEPNRTVGFRVRATLADPDVWYAANAATGRGVFRLGAVITVAALVLPWWLGSWALASLLPAAFGGLAGIGAWGTLYANRLLAARERAGRSEASAPTG